MNTSKMTNQEMLVEYYKHIRGCIEIDPTKKYRVLVKPGDTQHKYFIGHKGGVRVGSNVTESISLTHQIDMKKIKADVEAI